MISYIRGTLEAKEEGSIVVDRQGMGYQILVPGSVLDTLPDTGTEVKIHTYLHVREDLMQLFGFRSRDDRELFKMLITVSGIGPKGGLGLLGTLSSDEIRFAVLSDDAKTIAKAPGIGAKTARKLILELKDKMELAEVVEGALDRGESAAGIRTVSASGQMVADAVEALTALGYSSAEAMKAVRSVPVSEDMTVEMLLKQSLKYL